MNEGTETLELKRHLAVKVVMMPRDTNPMGTIFGGVLLSYIDQAGVVGAQFESARQQWPQRVLVTVAMNAVEFHQPVFVGDIVSFWTTVRKVGRTSITTHVAVECERGGATVKVTQADVIYVAIDPFSPTRKPLPIRGES
jgi:acyl-CoA thioesterase YciA